MKLLMFLILVILLGEVVHGNWKIGTIHNDSDLILESAWYIKPSRGKSKQRYIDYLSTQIQRAIQANSKKIVFDYSIANDFHGCSFIQTTGGYRISFDSKLPYRVHYPKPKNSSSKKYVGKEVCHPSKDNFCARVFLEKEPLIGYAAHAYQKEGEFLDLYLSGSNGNYSLKLVLSSTK